MEWMDYAVSVLSGLAVGIPLVVALVMFVQKAIKEKNWTQLLQLVMGYMAEAEKMFADGATKKEWVMGMIEASAVTVNYPIDMAVVSKMIDDLCAMSKEVNAPEDVETVWEITTAVDVDTGEEIEFEVAVDA